MVLAQYQQRLFNPTGIYILSSIHINCTDYHLFTKYHMKVCLELLYEISRDTVEVLMTCILV